MVDGFRKGKFELLALTGIKMKCNGTRRKEEVNEKRKEKKKE